MSRKRKRSGKNINGILLLDKPLGISSNAALQQVKNLYQAQKAGHTGSLDPLATGMLPVCFGIATRLSGYLLGADKHYEVGVKLGETTATGDAEGEVLEKRSVDHISEDQIAEVLSHFQGTVSQLPPMYSALKHKGQRLYTLARKGIEVERQPREITIHQIQLGVVKIGRGTFTFQVHCSKGTYVRTLVEDIGKVLQCGAHVAWLRRTGVGPYVDKPMHTMQQLQICGENNTLDTCLLPADTAVLDWPEIYLNKAMSYYIQQGQPLMVPKAPTEGWVRLYQEPNQFIGVGEVLADGRIAPKRLISK